MQESRTRRALDTLADLLLTGPAAKSGDAAEAALPAASPPQPKLSAPTPRLQFTGNDPPAATVEAVLLGHLPGYATPWISQFAQHVGETRGRAALLRIEGQQVEVECFSPGPEALPGIAPAMGGSAEKLDQLLGRLAAHVTVWLIAISGDARAAVESPWGAYDRWNLLSGSDDAAVVGAYRLLKTLIEEADAEAPRLGVGMMFMGCEDAAARGALQRISRAASAFLATPVELEGSRPRMLPIHRQYLGRFDAPGEQGWARLGRHFGRSLAGSEDRDDSADDSEPLLSEQEIQALTAELEDARMAQPMDPPLTPEVASHAADFVKLPTASSRSPRPAEAEAEPELSIVAESPPAVGLTGYVAGLSAMQARCPRQPAVELATDAAGSLHLLISVTGDTDSAVRKLMEARGWAMEHRALLSLTLRQGCLEPGAEPVLHLFTDQPRSAADLACSGPIDRRPIRLHLLKPITVGMTTVMIHEPLNH